eukprot:418929_1
MSNKHEILEPDTLENILKQNKWCLWFNAKQLNLESTIRESLPDPKMKATSIDKKSIGEAIVLEWERAKTRDASSIEQINNNTNTNQPILPPNINTSDINIPDINIPNINMDIESDVHCGIRLRGEFIGFEAATNKECKIKGLLPEMEKFLLNNKFILIRDENDKIEINEDEQIIVNVSEAGTFLDLFNMHSALDNAYVVSLEIQKKKTQKRATSKFATTKLTPNQWHTNQFTSHTKRLSTTNKENGSMWYLYGADIKQLMEYRGKNDNCNTPMKWSANGAFLKDQYQTKLNNITDLFADLTESIVKDELDNKPVGIAMSLDTVVEQYKDGNISKEEYIKQSMLLIHKNSESQLGKKIHISKKKKKKKNNSNNTNNSNNSESDSNEDYVNSDGGGNAGE